GAPASVSEFLPPAALTSLIQQACASAGAVRLTMPADGALSFAGLTWGSSTSPQVRCIEGLASPGDSVVFSGNATGAGLLVVRNADLVLAGPLRWEGWIVVTGENVSLRVTGQDTKEVFGAVTLIEDSPTLPAERFTLNVQGWLNVFYSRGGLGKAVALIPAAALEDNYAFLPTVISQDHWHALTP
ncbi:MAG TPA: hypothetical protein VNO43_03070, partial [Candidatus Eisenbacteria bacterium]|nr:hypothetical protein [Candidatus Eisenbacteria bacterium]